MTEMPPAGTTFATTYGSMSAGFYHTCGVTTQPTATGGNVVCWGLDFDPNTPGDDPNTPPAGVSFASVSGGNSHTCGVTTDDAIACWGNQHSGQSTPPTAVACGSSCC